MLFFMFVSALFFLENHLTVGNVLSVVLPDYFHCNYEQARLWIVEDRAAWKIWPAADVWYSLVCEHLLSWGSIVVPLLLAVFLGSIWIFDFNDAVALILSYYIIWMMLNIVLDDSPPNHPCYLDGRDFKTYTRAECFDLGGERFEGLIEFEPKRRRGFVTWSVCRGDGCFGDYWEGKLNE